MRKLAMLLASILTLNLVAPAANVYAAPADSMTELVADEATIYEEGDVSGNNSSTSGNDTSASGNNPANPGNNPTDPGNNPSVSNNDPSVSNNDPSVSNNDPSVSNNDPSVSNNDPSVSNNDPSVSNNDPSVSENEIKDLFVTEKYYNTQKGYPLVGIIKVPYLIDTLDWPNYVFNFKELNVSVDDGEAKEVQVTKSNQYTYGHNSENMTNDGFYVLFNAGYDKTIMEGTHKLTYTGIVSDGRKDFEFEVSAEAEFTDGDVSYPRSDRRNKQFMSAYKDSLVKMIYSGFDLEDYDEKITEVKLRNSETKQEYATELLYKYDYNKNSSTGGRYKGFVGLPEGSYLSIFNEDYYGYSFHCSIQLKEEVPEGDYDLVFITSEGNRNIVEDYYKATKKPVVLGLYPNSIKEKSGTVDFYKTGLPIYTDNSGDYVSVFVYGLNLTKDNIPVFYNEDRSATVTEYTETEEQCGYEAWEYGFDFTVKKTGEVNVSGNQVNIPATVTGDVIYADGWSSDVIDESEVALSYYQSLIDRSEYNISAQTLRFYLTPGFVEENDVIHISTSRYSDGENYDANVVCDGREYYIEIDKATALYQNYTTYNTLIFTINDEDTEYFYGKYYSMYDFDDVKYINNVKVPANYSWEIHDVTAVSEAFYSGKNGSTAKNVLTTTQVTDLMDEGLCRVCIYDNKGNVSDRYLAYFTSAPTYKITYVLNGGINSTENPLHYTKNQEVVLKTPTYEYNTFLGWYSDEKCTKKVTKIAKGSTGDKTFYAKWRPNQYSVTYYPNGPKGNPVTKKYPYNHNIVFPQNLFTYPGYKLGGWTENADGTGVMYELSCSIPALSKEDGAKFELYAKWEPAHYTIVLDKGSNAAEITDGTVEWYNNRFEVAYDDEFVLMGNEYIYPGHKLTGWKTDSGKKIANGEVSRLSAVDGGEVTLYAQWAVENYTITYDYDGGKVKKANPKTYTYETEATTLNVPTKKGYIFNGYYAFNPETGMEEPIALIGGGMTGNLKIKAKYSPISYTVVLKETQDSTEEESIKIPLVYDNEYLFERADYQKNGYTLSAWSTKPNGKGTKYKVGQSYKNLTAEHDKEITLYACWTKDSYSITYSLDGGKNHKKNPKKYAVDTKTIELKDPTKTGYTFKGWYVVQPDGALLGDTVEKIEKGSTGDLVLKAVWEQNSYMLKLHPNTTTYVSENTLIVHPYVEQEVAYEDGIIISDLTKDYVPTEEYVDQGYGILYWSTKANGKGKKYYPDEMYSKLKTEGTLELYAKWGMTPYAITYVGTEGIKNQNPATYTYHKDNVIVLKDVAKKGYVFGGWYTTPSYEEETQITTIDRSKRVDVTVYAKFTPVSYKVVLAPNGADVVAGDGEKEFTKAYDEAFSVSGNTYTKEHYRIKYWSTKANGKGTKVYSDVEKAWNLSATEDATVTLYPKWELTPYTITYHNVAFDGERVVNKNPNSYKYNSRKEVKLKNPTRTGYVFGGWYEEDTTAEGFDVATAEKITKITKGASGDMELYALWTPITFNVKFEANGKNVVLNEEQKDVENVTYGELLMVKPVYSRKGYNLVGFNTKKNGKGTMYATGMEHTIFASKANSTVKLYAIWEKVTNEKISSLELSSDSGSVTVWYAQNEDCNHYKVAISEFFTMTNARTVETGSDTVTFDGLESGKRYYVRVREIRFDSMGNPIEGPWSSLVSIKTTE